MGTKAKALVLSVFVAAPFFAHPAAAGSHSNFLTWQHNQEQKAAQQRGYIRSGCGFECLLFGVVVRQLVSERSQRIRQPYPAARRY